MDISVVIPVFNEKSVIADTIAKVKAHLQKNFKSFEILVVDDGSRDGSREIIGSLPGIVLLANDKNQGKGYSVIRGLRAARGEYRLFMDADLSTPIDELGKLWPYRHKYGLVIGSRGLADSQVLVSQSILKVFLGKAGNLVSRLLIHPSIKDTQCGFKLISQSAVYLLDKMTIKGWAFDFELIYLCRKYRVSIKEVPVRWYNNFDSKVKWRSYPHTLIQLFRIKINDLLNKY